LNQIEFFNKTVSFDYIKTNTTIQIGKAKALYDQSIAIMKIETTFNGNPTDLFYESDTICTLYYNHFWKKNTCLRGKAAYDEYIQKNPLLTHIVFVNHQDILDGILKNSDGTNRFGVLYLTDYVLGAETMIEQMLTSNGINAIKTFVNNGGTLIVNGKSGYLLEKWGIFPSGTFDTKKLIIGPAKSEYRLDMEEWNETTTEDSFNKRLILMEYQPQTFVTNSYLMKRTSSMPFEIYTKLPSKNLIIKENSEERPMTDAEKEYLPCLMYKKHGKGHIVFQNANPTYKIWYRNLAVNIYFLSMLKPVIFDYNVKFGDGSSQSDEEEELPIPGGEGGIALSTQIYHMNIFDKATTNVDLHIFIPLNVSFTSIPSACVNDSSKLKELSLNESIFETKYHLKCSQSTLDAYKNITYKIGLEILDQSVTKQLTGITIIYPVLYYTDGETSDRIFIDTGGLKVEAKLGAILRGSINPDPSSTYPMPGRGYVVDNVLQV
ncbi:MAG: hypothetical protein MJ252_30920, partial [archaeon]|nr:hypothetical protein [archaeon]